jgi:Tat protein secretion system quality control protein TatD with DNase activity
MIGGAMELFDVHCHCLSKAEWKKSTLVKTVALQSSEEPDWAEICSLQLPHHKVLRGIGIHPWYAHQAEPGWKERLENTLEQHPDSFVGEIGLDKHKGKFDAQLPVFGKRVEEAFHFFFFPFLPPSFLRTAATGGGTDGKVRVSALCQGPRPHV